MSEKLCLQWNDFKENICASFGELRGERDFSDVTLVCEDGQQVEAHKVILAASSPILGNLLKRRKHLHPMIFMRGLNYEDLVAIVDFLYLGEANVFQENLDSFLTIADELQLKGLMREEIFQNGKTKKEFDAQPSPVKTVSTETPRIQKTTNREEPSNGKSNVKTLATTNDTMGYLLELEEKVKSMMKKSQNVISYGKDNQQRRIDDRCKVCGKEGHTVNIREHIEVNHLDGVAIPCNLCGQTFRSRRTIKSHTSLWHK